MSRRVAIPPDVVGDNGDAAVEKFDEFGGHGIREKTVMRGGGLIALCRGKIQRKVSRDGECMLPESWNPREIGITSPTESRFVEEVFPERSSP
jgi:hypothetical protein